ncbi:hypothetical protein OUZ56_026142 [Daphnia magna]|uniref:Secreted protein n=1 Tax=Daphnia magna TaxID=35525 RepID=A0ABQ9ZKZ2_9CRUS|nr:hypothetical protein OUZ56_026142 [Daphnia magna]
MNLATLELSTSAFVWLLFAMFVLVGTRMLRLLGNCDRLKNLTARCHLVWFSSLKGKPLKRAMVADEEKRFVKKVVKDFMAKITARASFSTVT